MTTQLDLFGEAKVTVEDPEPMTEVKLGHRSAQIPLRKQRKEALARLMEILAELEGKDIYLTATDSETRASVYIFKTDLFETLSYLILKFLACVCQGRTH